MINYLICGLSVSSELLLPGHSIVETASAEVNVLRGQVPAPCSNEHTSTPYQFIGDSTVLFRAPGVVRFQIIDGKEILFELEAFGSDEQAVSFLLSTVIGIVLHQRQLMVLHASAVMVDGRALAICGPSGAGKSTLAAAICQAGGHFVSDDISVISGESVSGYSVRPDGRQHRLWADSIQQLSLAGRKTEVVRAGWDKFHVEPADNALPVAVPLKAVIVLCPASSPSPATLSRLSPADAVALLDRNVFRRQLAERMGRSAQLFAQIAGLIADVPVLRFERLADFARIQDDVRQVLNQLERCK